MKTRWILLTIVAPVLAASLLGACGDEGAGSPDTVSLLVQAATGDAQPATPAQIRQTEGLVSLPAEPPTDIRVDYPLDESVFPPDLVQPTILWTDGTPGVDRWLVRVRIGDREALRVLVHGTPPPMGEIDEAARSATNELPKPPAPDVRSWRPDDATWALLKELTHETWAAVEIVGFGMDAPTEPRSSGRFTFMTSKDPVGAPIFYRDVPLAPIQTKTGVIMPLPRTALRIVKWRLRDVSKQESRVLLEGMPTCANCHSFSTDGSTFGMDIDGPDGDKGTYGIVPVSEHVEIDYDDIVTWNEFPDKKEGLNTFGFLSRVSPDGRYVVSTVNEALFVANFTDYQVLQVFYPTRGILAWLDTTTREMKPLPGADDEAYVHCSPSWTPDGKHLVYCRAPARDPYEEGTPLAAYPNDPNEPQVRYDLVRMPFNDGKGGTPVPVDGASANGMSNTFPKVSPDGKWIVYTKCRNGLLMRPDGKLWIVPAEGGEAREMRCNTWRMNSWHSWSPNGRWLVFSSKAYSPYTQMLLTHIDEDGNDTPAVVIPNATAANRAVNIPEFVNTSYESFQSIDVPGVRHRRDMMRGTELMAEGRLPEALTFYQRAVAVNPEHAGARISLSWALSLSRRFREAADQCEEALRLDPTAIRAHLNLGHILLELGEVDDAVRHTQIYLTSRPRDPQARRNLAFGYLRQGRSEEALEILRGFLTENAHDFEAHKNMALAYLQLHRPADAVGHLDRVVRWNPNDLAVANALAWQLATSFDPKVRDGRRAVGLAERLARGTGRRDAGFLDTLAAAYAEAGRFDDAVAVATEARALAPPDALGRELEQRLALYRAGRPFHQPSPR